MIKKDDDKMIKAKKYTENTHLMLFPKWQKIIVHIYSKVINDKKTFISQIAKETDVTFSHVNKIILGMIGLELVHTEPKGRMNYVQLTKKGLDVAMLVDSIMEKIGGEDGDK
jgi:predicted transcriptional regulator